ncbi:hypothetical protein VIFL103355_22345 [Vibrio fluvialis]
MTNAEMNRAGLVLANAYRFAHVDQQETLIQIPDHLSTFHGLHDFVENVKRSGIQTGGLDGKHQRDVLISCGVHFGLRRRDKGSLAHGA